VSLFPVCIGFLCLFSDFYLFQYLDLFLTRVHGLRRRIECGGEVNGVLDYSLIRETFQVCINVLFIMLLLLLFFSFL
jgi:hypothetical protein